MRINQLAILSALSSIALALPTLAPRQSPDFIYPGDAPYGVDIDSLASILTCPYGTPTSKPVLLVPGTGSTGEESFGQGYIPALKANGYSPCYLTPPDRLLGDMQVTSAYIAYNVHLLSSISNSTIAIMGHSQGNPVIQWALRFWPSTRSAVSMYVGLSPDMVGIGFDGLSDLCDIGYFFFDPTVCPASIWQQIAGSHYLAALDDGAGVGFEELVPTTLIWSLTDEVVIPSGPNADLPGAVNIPVQALCPGRITDHVTMLIDAAGFALALDGLNNNGTADLARVQESEAGRASCGELAAPHMDVSVVATVDALFDTLVDGFLFGPDKVAAEPVVMSYALPQNQ